METKSRFLVQENQAGECMPCTLEVFNHYVDSPNVDWRITTRQEVEAAINEGLPLSKYLNNTSFIRFCEKRASEKFNALTDVEKLLQWTQSLKDWLPCFIFGVNEFGLVQKTDKDGNPILDKDGNPVMYHRRKLENILHLSGLFMFDADHLTCDPYEIFKRTQVPGFPWNVPLAHKTSSRWGLRLVCEARPELGNIADNQICLARDLGLMGVKGSTGKPVVDDSCIDATRISYCPRREDIYFIDENKLFNF